VLDDQQPYLGCLDTWDAWYRWRDILVDRYEAQGDFCPLGSLFLQVGRTRPGARAIVTELMSQWQASLAAGIRALQRNGHLPESVDVDQSAAALLAGIQGGVSIMLSTGDSAHLRAALDWWITWMQSASQRSRAATAEKDCALRLRAGTDDLLSERVELSQGDQVPASRAAVTPLPDEVPGAVPYIGSLAAATQASPASDVAGAPLECAVGQGWPFPPAGPPIQG
jgi:hypothetical protein